MRNSGSTNFFIIAVTVLAVAGAPQALAGIKCWTNNEGVRECGNAVPPEYAQQGHEEISGQGLTVNKQTRAKTAEELEQERLAQERLEQEKELAKEQARRDNVLLATYATEFDMRLAHQGKIAAIDSRINHAEQLVARLHESLVDLIKDAAEQERNGSSVSDETLSSIRQAKRQILEQKEFIAQRKEEKVELNGQFEKELERFRHLKGR